MAETRTVGVDRERREDPALITGEADYTDDLAPPGTLQMGVVRSRYGHAWVEGVDTAAAEAREDVHAVLTGADLADADVPGVVRPDEVLPGQRAPELPLLADDRVRYAGEPVAVVVAEDRYAAADAAEAVDVEYERLEAVTDPVAALEEDAPVVHESLGDNLGLDWRYGDDEETIEEAFAAADRVVDLETHNQRVHPDALEPRAALAAPEDRRLVVRMATQAPNLERGLLAEALGLDPEDVRVVAPAVGGGFGSKSLPYVEQVLVGWCARRLDRPVKWTATRTEGHRADHHGRDMHTGGELAVDEDGTVRALRLEAVSNVGAYLKFPTSPWPNFEHLSAGAYRVPVVGGRIRAAFTNTAPIAPYRGAGRPEVIFILERLMDRAAAELGMDPAEFRRRNFVPPEAFPYETPVSATYDSGNYERALDAALDLVGYGDWRERQAAAHEEGRYLGVGVASFVENTGTSPDLPEGGRVDLEADGTVVAHCGTADHGQGHATAFGQVIADELGVDDREVVVREGDSDFEAGVGGTFGSRSIAVGASALVESARAVREQAREVAARELEAGHGDVVFEAGEFHPAGAPGRSIGLAEVARVAAGDGNGSEGGAGGDHGDGSGDGGEADHGDGGQEPALTATTTYTPENYAHSFGTHVAVVEVDPRSGEVEFRDYAAVDDCGTVVNPTIVEGQVHGGVAQGVGQALYERAVYDDNGSLVTGSLQDYALPKATHLPEMRVGETETPSPHTPTGAKGVGEGGAIVAPPAVVNAVVDALRPLGVESLEMPVTSETVWRAVHGE